MKYIKRSTEGILVTGNKKVFMSKGLKQLINDLCIRNLSTFEGRERAARVLLNRKSILPIYVNDDICLFPTESIRNYACIYINYNELLSFKEMNKDETKIIFYDLSEIFVNVSSEKIRKQLVRVQTILAEKNAK